MKKAAALIIATLILTSGCSSAIDSEHDDTSSVVSVSISESTTSSDQSEKSDQSEELPKTEEEYHEDMVERSLTSIGNASRLKDKIEQAKSGKKTVVAYLGGSITEGYAGGADGCYAKLSYNYFAETYGTGDNVEYVNAGLSGTASTVGNLRVQRDVLAYEPDIVFIEYAVNDSQDIFTKTSYESLVKTILTQENEPAVVLIFNRTVDGYSAQQYMKAIGTQYSLPMISVVDAITPEIDEGRMKWEDYSVDEAHPSPDGHKLISEFIEHMYKVAEETDSTPYELPQLSLYGAPYANASMATFGMLNDDIAVTDIGSFTEIAREGNGFPGYWEYKAASEDSEPMKLTAKGSAFIIICRTNNQQSMGSVDVYINGELAKTVSSREDYGWGGAAAYVIAEYDEIKEMDIEIYPSPDDSDGKIFNLFGFATANNAR